MQYALGRVRQQAQRDTDVQAGRPRNEFALGGDGGHGAVNGQHGQV